MSFEVRGVRIDRSTPTITFVNRNLERLRGFDLFMRALPRIQHQHPTVRILIVGDNESGYGGSIEGQSPLKERMLKELSGQLDLSRLHFLGRVPHSVLMALFQASWVHVYLSYNCWVGVFLAMACGCCIVGSEGIPSLRLSPMEPMGSLPLWISQRSLIAFGLLSNQLARALQQSRPSTCSDV